MSDGGQLAVRPRFLFFRVHTHTHTHEIRRCVCVCVCVCGGSVGGSGSSLLTDASGKCLSTGSAVMPPMSLKTRRYYKEYLSVNMCRRLVSCFDFSLHKLTYSRQVFHLDFLLFFGFNLFFPLSWQDFRGERGVFRTCERRPSEAGEPAAGCPG